AVVATDDRMDVTTKLGPQSKLKKRLQRRTAGIGDNGDAQASFMGLSQQALHAFTQWHLPRFQAITKAVGFALMHGLHPVILVLAGMIIMPAKVRLVAIDVMR